MGLQSHLCNDNLFLQVFLIQFVRLFEFSVTGDPVLDNWDMVEKMTTKPKNPFFNIRPL